MVMFLLLVRCSTSASTSTSTSASASASTRIAKDGGNTEYRREGNIRDAAAKTPAPRPKRPTKSETCGNDRPSEWLGAWVGGWVGDWVDAAGGGKSCGNDSCVVYLLSVDKYSSLVEFRIYSRSGHTGVAPTRSDGNSWRLQQHKSDHLVGKIPTSTTRTADG